jgi:hypothetical protein
MSTSNSNCATRIKYIDNTTENNSSNDTSESCTEITNEKIHKIEMLKYIKKKLEYMDNENLQAIQSLIEKNLSNNDNKYFKMEKIVLEIINKILMVMGEKQIYDLSDCIKLSRDELIKDKYKNIIDENLSYLFQNGFSKYTCMYYQKKSIKYYHLSVIKNILKTVGYMLVPKQKNRAANEEKSIITYYTIKKIQTDYE